MNKEIYIGPLKLSYYDHDNLVTYWDEDVWHKDYGISKQYDINIHAINEIEIKGILVHDYLGIMVYKDDDMEYRYYYQSVDPTKKIYAYSYMDNDKIELKILKNSKFSPQSLYSMIGIEKLLLKENAVSLHSASVIYHDKAILFSAPSGTGKSTQADLWKKYSHAVGFNGDRNLLWKKDDQWYVVGYPWHGTSTDCINACVPLRCIAIIRQDKMDRIKEMHTIEKVMFLHGEATVNRWDEKDVEKSLDLVEDLVKCVDVVELDCTMNESAVEVLKDYLKGDDNGDI